MPTLPSGRTPALSMNHILPPGVVTFKCPEGHFWFQKPDLALSPRPYEPDADVFCDFAHAPCPTTREEALGLLHVVDLIGPDRKEIHWRGYCVAEPEALADLTPEDRAAWDAWVATPKVQAFLDEVVERCRRQAEANRKNPGYMVFTPKPPRG
jgi:hypothetical protein